MTVSWRGSPLAALVAQLRPNAAAGELGRALVWLAMLVGHSALIWFLCGLLLQSC